MVSSRAWFVLAVAAVLGLFYVGAGLRSDSPGLAVGRVAYGQEAATKKKSLSFESIGRAVGALDVYRTKVPGGWLVATERWTSSQTIIEIAAFVPDPEHKWDGNSLP